jgi:hypothetical protein
VYHSAAAIARLRGGARSPLIIRKPNRIIILALAAEA